MEPIQDAEAWLVVVFVVVDVLVNVDVNSFLSLRTVYLTNYKQKIFNLLNVKA
jgi:hypothetical protein